jgi:hypothetical protein
MKYRNNNALDTKLKTRFKQIWCTYMWRSRIQCVGLVFVSQPGTTSSQLSVPSEETDRSSVFIPAIHFSQDRGPTFRAAANSGLSQGCVSGNQWPSPDERNDLSAARRVENPEVNIKSEGKTEVILTVVGCKYIASVSFKIYEALNFCNRHLETGFLCHSKHPNYKAQSVFPAEGSNCCSDT